MKKLFLLAWPIALAAVSCSNEEVVSVNNDANEIKFTVVAENGTRAQNVFCNFNLPTEFHVWAAVDGKQYFEKVQYKKNGDKYTAEGGEVHFWPAEAVDFYAVTEETTAHKDAVPGVGEDPGTPEVAAAYFDWATPTATHKFNWNIGTASTITWETRSDKASKQTDLLYAYTQASRPAGNGGDVPLNFRHALSQIVFKAVNTNATIKVEIDQVEVVNIASKGTFTMPIGVANKTDDNINDHTTGGTYESGVGSWSGQGTPIPYDTEKFTLVPVVYNEGVQNLTDEVGTNAPANHPIVANSLLLIPQTTTPWDKTAITPSTTGSYFKVWCKIWNVSGAVGGADLLLWGDTSGAQPATKPVYIPFTAAWEPGKKYIYTFNFGTSTTGGYEEDGDPVLIPISFTVKVDDFVKVAETGVPME